MDRGRAAFVVLGCAKNQVEAESMAARLARDGWSMTADVPNADLVVVHSCGFLESARAEAQSTLDAVRRAAPASFLVLTGCYAQFINKKKWPGVDAVIGTGQLDRLSETLLARRPSTETAGPGGLHDPTLRALRPGQLTAYVRVSEGCDHRCTFCIIPQLRGSLKSRSADDIVMEVRHLAERGVREVVLISQDTTAYGTDRGRPGLTPLIRRLLRVPGVSWLRILYAYPSEVGPALVSMLGGEAALCRYLDMPLQHISDRVLRAMGRDAGERRTRGLLDRLRKNVPGLALRTTFIVGFPGETEEDVRRLTALVEENHFEHVGVFPYSFERRSPSARLEGAVAPEEVQERWQRVLDAFRRTKTLRDERRLGRRVVVLAQKEADGAWSVRAPHQAPEVDGGVLLASAPSTPGFHTATVTGVKDIHLTGELIHEPA